MMGGHSPLGIPSLRASSTRRFSEASGSVRWAPGGLARRWPRLKWGRPPQSFSRRPITLTEVLPWSKGVDDEARPGKELTEARLDSGDHSPTPVERGGLNTVLVSAPVLWLACPSRDGPAKTPPPTQTNWVKYVSPWAKAEIPSSRSCRHPASCRLSCS